MNKKELVLVTGANGFIANQVIANLLRKHYRVRATVRFFSDTDKYSHLFEIDNGIYKDMLQIVELDLLSPESWDRAIVECTYLIHTASPNPPYEMKEEEFVKPAVVGTRNAMEAVLRNNVKRIVLTSSVVSCIPDNANAISTFNESHFTNPDSVSYYRKSKILQEQEAWRIYNANRDKMEMTIILPAFVMGPYDSNRFINSVLFVKGSLNREFPSMPSYKEPMVDVRDLAEAFVRAMTVPEANGERIIISEGTYHISYVGEVLRKAFKSKGYDPVTEKMSYMLYLPSSYFFSYLRGARPLYNREIAYDNKKSIGLLGMTYRPAEEAIVEMGKWAIANGYIDWKK